MVCSLSLAYFSSSASRQIACSGMASATMERGSVTVPITIYGVRLGRLTAGCYCYYVQYMSGTRLRQGRDATEHPRIVPAAALGGDLRACSRTIRPHIPLFGRTK